MNKIVIASLISLSAASVFASDGKVIVLDLTKSTTELSFDEKTGSWNETYNEEAEVIESQCFAFVHSSMDPDYQTWWGFTASNSADNSQRENPITFQFSNMAEGGIVLDEDGKVKTDEFGAPVVSAEVPYLVAYYSAYMSARPVDMIFSDGKSHEVVGMYVNLNSYAFYSMMFGDSYARAFNNGDKFTLTIHGVAADNSEKEISLDLASSADGDLTINRRWRYVDLSELGEVNELYFTLSSTDTGTWGMNTPGYFCLDKLMVKEAATSGVETAMTDAVISYDRRSSTVSIDGAGFAMVCDVTGAMLMSGEKQTFDLSHLPAGVYIVKAGNSVVKIAK